MLKDNSQMSLELSPYKSLYDMIIPEKHLLRRIKEHIDFSFVNSMLRKQYCEHFGRPVKEPEMMFKLMFLKKLYDLSDEPLISSAQTDMAFDKIQKNQNYRRYSGRNVKRNHTTGIKKRINQIRNDYC